MYNILDFIQLITYNSKQILKIFHYNKHKNVDTKTKITTPTQCLRKLQFVFMHNFEMYYLIVVIFADMYCRKLATRDFSDSGTHQRNITSRNSRTQALVKVGRYAPAPKLNSGATQKLQTIALVPKQNKFLPEGTSGPLHILYTLVSTAIVGIPV